MTVPDSVSQLDGILKPKSVAVIGASTSPDKLGHEILRNILDGGYQGAVYPINPKADTILDLPCHTNVKELQEPPDLAVLIIPARFVPQVRGYPPTRRRAWQRAAPQALTSTSLPRGTPISSGTAVRSPVWSVKPTTVWRRASSKSRPATGPAVSTCRL